MEFRQFIEVHYTDLYPKNFDTFRKKYNRVVRGGDDYNLYVQFTNYSGNVFERKPYGDPDHSDPVGVYAYPLKYVITHPADIWYGFKAKFLRVLQDKSKNALYFYGMTFNKAQSILWDMGLDMYKLDYARKLYKHTGVNKWAKSFLSCVQMNLEVEPEIGGYREKKYPMRTSQEQANLFKKAGYDALIDNSSTNKQAVMNEREPNQIAFLTANAFRVVEVFQLRWGEDKFLASFQPEEESHGRKLAAMIFTALGDRLAQSDRGMFWSANGWRISIEFERPQSHYRDRKIGEKKHKEYKLAGGFQTTVNVEHSPKGKLRRVFSRKDKFKEIVDSILWSLSNNEDDPDFVPETKESYQAAVKKANDEEIRQRIAGERAASEKRNKELKPLIKKLARKLGLPFYIKRGANYEPIFAAFANALARRGYQAETEEDINKAIKELEEDGKKFAKEEKEWVRDLPSLGYLPDIAIKDRPDLKQLRDILYKAYRQHPQHVRNHGSHVIYWMLRELGVDV